MTLAYACSKRKSNADFNMQNVSGADLQMAKEAWIAHLRLENMPVDQKALPRQKAHVPILREAGGVIDELNGIAGEEILILLLMWVMRNILGKNLLKNVGT